MQSSAQPHCICKTAENLREKIGVLFNEGNYDSARYYTNLIGIENSKICQAMRLNSLAQIDIAQKDYVSARKKLLQEARIIRDINCPVRKARHFATFSLLYNFLNKLDSAAIMAIRGFEQAELAGDTLTQIVQSVNIGAYFYQLKQYDKALLYARKGLKLAKMTNNIMGLSLSNTQMASNFINLHALTKKEIYLDSAFYYAKEGVKYSKRLNSLMNYVESMAILGDYFIQIKDYSNANAFADSIIFSAPKGASHFHRHMNSAYRIKSQICYEQKRYREAIDYADSALRYAYLFNAQIAISSLEIKYKSSKEIGDFRTSILTFEKLTELKDSLFNLEKNEALAELEKKYIQTQNENTIKELEQVAEIKNLRIKILIAMVILSLVLIIVIVVFFRQQSLKSKQIMLETEQRLNRARINPHFFFNALSALQSIALKENDGKKLAMNLASFSELMRKTLESSYHDYVTIDEEIEFVSQYVALQQLRDEQIFQFEVYVQDEIETFEIMLPSMIIQPFLENSIEHGFSGINYMGKLHLSFKKNQHNLIIEIIDNGIGFRDDISKKKRHVSRAIQIIKDRLFLLKKTKKINCEFDISQNKDQGVTVQIILPLFSK